MVGHSVVVDDNFATLRHLDKGMGGGGMLILGPGSSSVIFCRCLNSRIFTVMSPYNSWEWAKFLDKRKTEAKLD